MLGYSHLSVIRFGCGRSDDPESAAAAFFCGCEAYKPAVRVSRSKAHFVRVVDYSAIPID